MRLVVWRVGRLVGLVSAAVLCLGAPAAAESLQAAVHAAAITHCAAIYNASSAEAINKIVDDVAQQYYNAITLVATLREQTEQARVNYVEMLVKSRNAFDSWAREWRSRGAPLDEDPPQEIQILADQAAEAQFDHWRTDDKLNAARLALRAFVALLAAVRYCAGERAEFAQAQQESDCVSRTEPWTRERESCCYQLYPTDPSNFFLCIAGSRMSPPPTPGPTASLPASPTQSASACQSDRGPFRCTGTFFGGGYEMTCDNTRSKRRTTDRGEAIFLFDPDGTVGVRFSKDGLSAGGLGEGRITPSGSVEVNDSRSGSVLRSWRMQFTLRPTADGKVGPVGDGTLKLTDHADARSLDKPFVTCEGTLSLPARK